MNIALVTLLDDKFFIAYEGFWKSFIYHNPWFAWDFIILDNGLSEDNKEKIRNNYKRTWFRKIQKVNYREINFGKTHEKLRATYYTLDAFLISNYDRIVFMDMDITVLGDIRELFACEHGFAACKAYNSKMDELVETFNSGVFIVQKEFLTKDVYNCLLRIAKRGFSMPDQKVLNTYFREEKKFINKRYNVEKRMMNSVKYKNVFDEAKILHWIAEKPWQEKTNDIEASFKNLEKIWWEYYNG